MALSAHDHAEAPDDALLEAIMLTIDPYVPVIIRKVPKTITRMLQDDKSTHFTVGLSLPLPQLSYNHMQPMGWNDMEVPRRAPIRETKSLKMGIPLAMR